ncbi:tetratricopeptide repeat protein [Roseofilum casamattae]|uniref:Tetratricopeptide repeat protein n=1 Tax=Roseofilum casamattae BLCC-M143 TaxID=3022442 RepID=A0ABT7BSQ0_9CYAN|nr:hypothetical protein [Roseofilum casamattae]MDJ1182214.1 hypothetical protein [Roseofilum casamattae BLCC-M143]
MVKNYWLVLCGLTFLFAVGITDARADDRLLDPLLPEDSKNRSLTPQEPEQLGGDLDDLDRRARELLRAGNRLEAFALWQRELMLRQGLGNIAEVRALARVGDIAWSEGELTMVRQVTNRLDEIQAIAEPEEIELWRELARAYDSIRSPQSAIAVYQRLLEYAIAESNPPMQAEMLNQIAQTHLNWFDCKSAIPAWQNVLQFAIEIEDISVQDNAYQQLAYCYDETGDVEATIESRLARVDLAYQLGDLAAVPREQITIGDRYQTLGKLQTAAQLYEQAYLTAFELQHLGQASTALQRLSQLYRDREQWSETLAVYRSLLAVQAQGYDAYGMMNTYGRMADVYVIVEQPDRARAALERGLKLARQLRLNPDRFLKAIEQLSDRSFHP